MRTLTTLEELDEKLTECEQAARISDDELRRVFQTFRMDLSAQLPPDPFSLEYANVQMELYERIAGRSYKTSNEESIFDLESAITRPFPYTGSCQTAGVHLSALGFLLRQLQPPPKARILDLGAGWGNTTLALAQLGFEVTALDIEARFCELIRQRCRRAGVHVGVINSDFFWAETATGCFDAIVTFECFHHCADHMRLLRALRAALAPGGLIYFGAEPITPDFPIPWGLRGDGESLWAIRRNGWLELGFHPDYFREALRRAGMVAEVYTSADLPWINVWVARVRLPEAIRIPATDPVILSQAMDVNQVSHKTAISDREFITGVYRGLLGRDPDEAGMRHFSDQLRSGSLDRLGFVNAILSSAEFTSLGFGQAKHNQTQPRGCGRGEAEALFKRFRKYEGPGRPGFVTNFLGGLTDIRFVNLSDSYSGIVEGYPVPGNFHGETLEWIGTLRSVLDASGTFAMLELGAGWAPWCVIGYLAAKQAGINDIKVIAVEGDPGHIEFVRQTFAANGISEEAGKIISGAVGAVDGDAHFPKANDASRVYGGTAAYSEAEKATGAFADFVASQSLLLAQVERVPCFGLGTLMHDFDQIDLVHCDIQGFEAELFANTIELVSTKVKRVVIGTHSFEIDRRLACLFPKHCWDLEGIAVCDARDDNGRPVTFLDGVQVWRNTRLIADRS